MANSVLADTSVWVDHLRRGNAGLIDLLQAGQIYAHPFVIGELACGNLGQRAKILEALSELPQALVVDNGRVLDFLNEEKLMGRGLGWVDVSLLASAVQSDLVFWTLDRRLATAAAELDVALTT